MQRCGSPRGGAVIDGSWWRWVLAGSWELPAGHALDSRTLPHSQRVSQAVQVCSSLCLRKGEQCSSPTSLKDAIRLLCAATVVLQSVFGVIKHLQLSKRLPANCASEDWEQVLPQLLRFGSCDRLHWRDSPGVCTALVRLQVAGSEKNAVRATTGRQKFIRACQSPASCTKRLWTGVT